MSISFKLVFNQFFLLSTLFIVVQQIIVASSTFWVSQLALEASMGKDFLITLICFITSLVVVYIPGFFALIFSEKAELYSSQQYIALLFSRGFGKILARSTQLRDEILPIASSESFTIFDDAGKLLFELVSISLNVIFNVLVLSFVIEGDIVFYYICGAVFSLMAILLTSKIINRLSSQSLAKITQLKGIIYQFWDNVFIGNTYNFKIYHAAYQHAFNSAIGAKIKSVIVNNLASNLGMLCMISPILFYIFTFLTDETNSTELIIVLVATLPRQLMMMQIAYAAISQAIKSVDIYAKFNILDNYLHIENMEFNSVLHRVDNSQVRIVYNNVSIGLAELISNLPKIGRVTIRGGNGSGKSTIMSYIKA